LVYSGSIPLWTEYIRLEKVTEFDPLLLAESLQERVEVVMADSGLVDPFEVDVAIIIGVDLVFAVEVYPEVTAALEGLRIESQTPDEAWEHIAALEEVRVTPPFGGLLQVVSTYVADLTSVLAVVIEPSASVDTWIGDFDLLRFPIDVPLLDASEERAFEPVAYEHTLPELAELIDVWDFGEVAVGNVSNLSLPIENLGQHPLSGDVLIDGDLAFTVFPDAVFVPAVGEDGLTVSFAPEQVGPVQATLLVQTNDPAVPEVVIALSGSGYDPFPPDETTTTTTPTTPEATEPDDEGGGERIPEDALGSSPIQMCGCASGQNGGSSWLGLLMLVLYRRRRSAGT
jgi:MYXO-CTERM domain-containing protein